MKWRILHHVLPLIVFVMFAGAFYAYTHYHYVKDPGDSTADYTFTRTFLRGRYDQGLYRGIGVTAYRFNSRAGWYPGASIVGGISWRVIGRPGESVAFYLCYYIPSMLAGMGFFYCFYRYAFKKWGGPTAILAIISLVCFPPSFYYLTAFPYNIALACMTGYMLLYESRVRGRMIWLGILAFFCSITYPTAVFFILYPCLSECVEQVKARRFRLTPYLAYGLPFILGPLVFFSYLYFVTGDFFAYLHHQGQHFDRTFGSPLNDLMHYFRSLPVAHPENLATIVVLAYLALFSNKKIGLPLWGFLIAILLFSPMTGSFRCVYRHYLLAFPMHYLFATSAKSLYVKIPFAGFCGLLCGKYYFLLYLTHLLL